jgi:hypothetical protein
MTKEQRRCTAGVCQIWTTAAPANKTDIEEETNHERGTQERSDPER